MKVLNISGTPADLDECFAALGRCLPAEELDRIKSMPERDMIFYHSNLGRQLRNAWGLWTGSRLQSFFHDLGLQHADDMSGVILTSFWRHVHGEPIRLDEQIARYRQYWEGVEIGEPDENGVSFVRIGFKPDE